MTTAAAGKHRTGRPAGPRWRDPQAWLATADVFAVLTAATLPWSTSLPAICAAIWLVVLLPAIDWRDFARLLREPACYLPVALFALALAGTLWSTEPWGERLHAVNPTVKLLALPFLFYHFRHSQYGTLVFATFVLSCTLLMLLSWLIAYDPHLAVLKSDIEYGVPVKNYIDQSQEFVLCIVGLAWPLLDLIRRRRFRLAALLVAVMAGFVLNMMFVAVSRTALVTLPVILAAFVLLHLSRRAAVATGAVAVVVMVGFWMVSPNLRHKLVSIGAEFETYQTSDAVTSGGLRLEFWRKSVQFFIEAPLFGHGSGSTRALFTHAAQNQEGVAAEIISNPHNQTLNVAVQWGLVGVAVLYLMWLCHLMLFRGLPPGYGLAAWIGLAVVLQNFLSSLFNSHLFDFHEGWMYVLGVGVAGGIALSGDAPSGAALPQRPPLLPTRSRAGIAMTSIFNFTWRNWVIVAHDVIATVAAVLVSFWLRFDGSGLVDRLPLLLKILPYFIALSVVVCYLFQLTTTKWRFVSLPDLLNIVRAASVLTVALLVLDYIFVTPTLYGGFFFGKTTIIIYWFVQIFFLSGARLAYRYFRYTRSRNRVRLGGGTRTLLIGRAADAEVFLRGVESGAVKQLVPVGILSPALSDRGQVLRGIPVLGGIDDLVEVIADFELRSRKIERVVMMPSAFEADAQPDAVLTRARKFGINVSRLPSLEESRDTPHLAPVAVDDLLLRPSIKIDYARLEAFIRGKAVVVTGGGGSIGSEICDRVVTFGASRLLVIENSEPALHAITERLAGRVNPAVVEGHIADIRDRERIRQLIVGFAPDIVFHAAALKHVPILERDWEEGIKTNIFGSVNVADATVEAGAEAMVMISTDKAIEPVSMLGLTKRFAEMYCQALDRELAGKINGRRPIRLISVRFGNVLASNGSVVPKFKAQIEAGGPVTVTHPDMVRYFMTIREACDLVVTSATHAVGAARSDVSVYVLNMGRPVRIVDLARRMIELSGLQVGYDIDIVFTGVRPGERLHEILFAEQEPASDIGIAGVVAARPNEPPLGALRQWLAKLEAGLYGDQRHALAEVLKDAVPEFRVGHA